MGDRYDAMAEEYVKKPYTRVLIPADEGGYVAEVLELPGCMSQGETPEEAYAMLEEALALYIATLLEDGRPVPEPIGGTEQSGRIALRTSSELHRRAMLAARAEGISLNQWIALAMEARLGAAQYRTGPGGRARAAVRDAADQAPDAEG